MKIQLSLSWTLVALGLLFLTWQKAGIAEDGITKEKVVEAIRRRQVAVRSLKIEWTEACFAGSESHLDPRKATVRGKQPRLPDLPPDGLTYEQSHTFSLEGDQTNHISSLWAYNADGNFSKIESRDTFNDAGRLMLRKPNAARPFFDGRIYPKNSPNHAQSLAYLEPIYQCFRLPVNEKLLANMDAYDLDSAMTDINNVQCIKLAGLSVTGGIFYLDPAREFRVARFVRGLRDRIDRQTDFEYVRDPIQGWMLSGWNSQKYRVDGGIASSTKATVKKCEINPRLEPMEFTIAFPVGCYVDDLRNGRPFIQRENGKIRPILRSENHLSYETLVDTEPGELE